LGSYGPVAGGVEAVANDCDVADEGDRLGSDDEGSAEVAAFVVAFGDDVILSASEFAAFG
jgi:hypothetical protein